jgi:hypothetical protein
MGTKITSFEKYKKENLKYIFEFLKDVHKGVSPKISSSIFMGAQCDYRASNSS